MKRLNRNLIGMDSNSNVSWHVFLNASEKKYSHVRFFLSVRLSFRPFANFSSKT